MVLHYLQAVVPQVLSKLNSSAVDLSKKISRTLLRNLNTVLVISYRCLLNARICSIGIALPSSHGNKAVVLSVEPRDLGGIKTNFNV